MSTTPSATLPPKRPPPRGIPLALSLPGGSSSSSSTSSSGSSVSRGGSSAVVSVSSASSSSTKATTTATSNSTGSSPYSILPTSCSLNATSAAGGTSSSSSSTTTAIPSARPSLAIKPVGGSSSSCPLLPASQSAASASHLLSSPPPPPPPPPPLSAAPPLPDASSTTFTQPERSKQPHLSTVTSSLSNLSLDIPKCSSSSEKEGHHYYRPEGGRSQDDSDDNDDDPDPSRWGKGDQERMAGELLRVIRGPSATSLNSISTTTAGIEEDPSFSSLTGGVHPFGAYIGRGREYSGKVGRNSRPNTGGSISSVSSSASLGQGTGYSLGNESSDSTGGLEHSSISPFVTPLDVVPTTLKDLGKLGEGASGEVRKVLHLPTGIIMAKKTISTSPNPNLHKQHLRELLFMRECSNPHIVQYYGAFLEDNDSQIGICMEFCEGGSLEVLYKKVKKNGWRTGEKILAKIAESILSGLVYLHDRKIIHRDIKPSNVLVTKEGKIKLCDFGVSGELINSLAGTFVGTTFYLSPERIRGGQYSITSDVWSTGLTVLEVALNRFPFPADGEAPLNGPIELLTYLVRMESPKLEDEPEYGIKYTNAFRNFIQLCLEKDPIRRPGPQKLLSHAWIRRSMERKPPPDLARWLRELKSE